MIYTWCISIYDRQNFYINTELINESEITTDLYYLLSAIVVTELFMTHFYYL